MKNAEQIRLLEEKTAELGIVHALHTLYGNGIHVEIGFSASSLEMPLDEISFSVRSMNALKRAGMFTVGDVVKILNDGDLMQVRNLGRKSANEIKTRILDYGFDELEADSKQKFYDDIVRLNPQCGNYG